MKEFDESFGEKKRWCPECRHRTIHELDKTPANRWNPELAPGWFCTECGRLNEQIKSDS